MTRLIKRYGSRKLYDTTESRYILLEDIAEYVRAGDEIQVVDNKTQEDVTSQTLTQVISEEGRKKANFLSSELLHDLIRAGESAVNNRVRQLQDGVETFMKKSIDRLVPLRTVRDEMGLLRERLEELEGAVARAEAIAGEDEIAADAPALEAPAKEDPTPEPEQTEEAKAPARKKTTTRRVVRKKATDGKTTTRSRTRKPAAKKASEAKED